MSGVFFSDPDLSLYHGDALEQLRTLPDESVHLIVTSPPFFGLRDYSVDGQIGLESSPQEWADRLVEVFRECRRVLRRDGTMWVECGDSYASHGATKSSGNASETRESGMHGAFKVTNGTLRDRALSGVANCRDPETKPKDLVGAPWLLAFALRADGWWLRGAYPWVKRNTMPESVRDRFTVCASTVFQFAKAPRYFFDGVAISEKSSPNTHSRGNGFSQKSALEAELTGRHNGFAEATIGHVAERWPRGIFDIPTEPNGLAICETCGAYWERGAPAKHCGQPVTAHYAAFPRALVERIVLCGTSERGVCSVCGAPWVRETARDDSLPASASELHRRRHGHKLNDGPRNPNRMDGGGTTQGGFGSPTIATLGWRSSCDHQAPIRPAVILDPFAGSGTSLLVARRLGRHAIGIELREAYARITENRLAQLSLLAEVNA